MFSGWKDEWFLETACIDGRLLAVAEFVLDKLEGDGRFSHSA